MNCYEEVVAEKNAPERGVSQGVKRGAEKKELRGVDKGVMEERITSIIIN